MMAALVIQWLALATLLAGGAVSLDNGLALTPPSKTQRSFPCPNSRDPACSGLDVVGEVQM